MNFGNAVKMFLDKRNIPVKDLAYELNITDEHMRLILRNKSYTTVESLKIISEKLDVPTDFLLQSFNKNFIVYAIDDYVSKLNQINSKELLSNCIEVLESEK